MTSRATKRSSGWYGWRTGRRATRWTCSTRSSSWHRSTSPGENAETDWLIERWGFTLDAIRSKPEALIGGVDWISKKWLLDAFRQEENLSWQDPWMQSLDLEYHNINPEKGLFFALNPAKAIGEYNDRVRQGRAIMHPPQDTRARGRSVAVAHFQKTNLSYVINWDSISCENQAHSSDERSVPRLRETDPEVFAEATR